MKWVCCKGPLSFCASARDSAKSNAYYRFSFNVDHYYKSRSLAFISNILNSISYNSSTVRELIIRVNLARATHEATFTSLTQRGVTSQPTPRGRGRQRWGRCIAEASSAAGEAERPVSAATQHRLRTAGHLGSSVLPRYCMKPSLSMCVCLSCGDQVCFRQYLQDNSCAVLTCKNMLYSYSI